MRSAEETEIFEVLNQRWSLLVLRHLCAGPIRFNGLAKLTGLNPNTLRERLKDFERFRIVVRTVISTSPPAVEYEMTSSGLELAGLFKLLETWHEQHVKFKKPEPKKPSKAAIVTKRATAKSRRA